MRFALVSGGVAAAHISSVKAACRATQLSGQPQPEDYPSYQPSLCRAYELWKTGKTPQLQTALSILEDASSQFPLAMPLLRERCLVLTALGRFQESQQLLRELRADCRRFGDFETLCRIGNTYKKQADAAWDADPQSPPIAAGSNHPSQQWFRSAYNCYQEAFEFSQDYYPGVNAAILALLLGNTEQAREHARDVLHICGRLSLGDLPGDDAYWVLCSEGEASVVAGGTQHAITCFSQALSLLNADKRGMAETSYTSLKRLGRVLDAQLAPVMDLFEKFLR
jgi:tetratricopeptide (TPR) repeat protein